MTEIYDRKNLAEKLRKYGTPDGDYVYTVGEKSYRDYVYKIDTKKGKEKYCIAANGYIKYFRKGAETPSNVHFPFLEEQLRQFEKEEFPPLPSPEVAQKPTLTDEETSWLAKVTQPEEPELPSGLEDEMENFLKNQIIVELLAIINFQDSQLESQGAQINKFLEKITELRKENDCLKDKLIEALMKK